MSGFFADVEANDSGHLDTTDGQSIYWETVGNPDGLPVLYFHGGPGAGASPRQRRFFDPDRFRAVIFDQRGCGRSRPLADHPDVDLSVNTTAHLLADTEAVREHLGIERWNVVLGLSWGATLAQAYAHAHRERVGGLVLGLVTSTSRREVEWISEDMGRIFPEQWNRLRAAITPDRAAMRVIDAYADMLADPDPEVRATAATEWCLWEDTHVSLGPGATPFLTFQDADYQYLFARLVTHFWSNHGFMDDDQLVQDAAALDGIPGVMIHGRYDVSSPMETPWLLAQKWTTARLRILDDGGHGSGDSFPGALVDALAEVADRSIEEG